MGSGITFEPLYEGWDGLRLRLMLMTEMAAIAVLGIISVAVTWLMFTKQIETTNRTDSEGTKT